MPETYAFKITYSTLHIQHLLSAHKYRVIDKLIHWDNIDQNLTLLLLETIGRKKKTDTQKEKIINILTIFFDIV